MSTGVFRISRDKARYWFYPLIPVVGLFAIALLWAAVLFEVAAEDRMAGLILTDEQALNEAHGHRNAMFALAAGGTVVLLPFFGLLTWVVRRLRAKTALLRAQRQFLRELLDNIPIGISVRQLKADGSGAYLVWNETNAVMYGVDKEKVLELPISTAIAPEDTVKQVRQWDAELMASPAVQEVVEHLRRTDGAESVIHRVRAPIFDGDAVKYVVTVSEDITRKRAIEDDVRLASKVFESTADGILISDRDDRVIRVNPAFTELTGFTQEEMHGHRVYESPFRPPDRAAAERRMERLRREGRVTAQIQRSHKDGRQLDLWLTATHVRGSDGEIVNYVRVFSDISQIRNTQLRLEQLANYDSLTGLPNRRLFADRIEQALQRARRAKGMVALLFLDLDGFKQVNDAHGHDVGDDLLKEVSRRLAGCVRSSDSLCRLGGDEFTVILGDVGSRGNASLVAESIINQMIRPVVIDGRRLQVGTSIGIALFPDHGRLSVELISSADAAMYRAKKAGGNRHMFFGDVPERLQKVA